MIRYKLYQNNNKSQENAYGKWYARVVIDETYDLEKLSEHMADHSTPYSAGVINGVLVDMVNCIRELILDGKSVKLDDLAIFSAGITSRGVDDPDEFNASSDITSVKLRARATGEMLTDELTRDASKKEIQEYSVDDDVESDDDSDSTDDSDSADSSDSDADADTDSDDSVDSDDISDSL